MPTLTRAAPGPTSALRNLVGRTQRDPLEFFAELRDTYGPVVRVPLVAEELYLLSDPRHIRDVLVTDQRLFKKGRGLERTKALLGEGLLTSEGATHLRQRRLIQPAFHKERLAGYAATMTAHAERTMARWRDGAVADVDAEMMRLTLGIVGDTLFGTDVGARVEEVGAALDRVMASFWIRMLPFAGALEWLPLPVLRRAREGRETLDRVIFAIIAERRQAPGDRGDLLSMLLLAQDSEDGHRGMSDRQVRDEAMTIFLAGHETTANALAWTWYLLSQAPEVECRLHEAIDSALGGRPPTVADLPALSYVERVVTESLRLYPPAWLIGRRALAPYRLDDYEVPAGAVLLMSPYLVHRDAQYFPDPTRFDPERWTPEFKAALPPFAYFPFGGGARRCIGDHFAMMELVLVVTAVAQRWRLALVPGHPVAPRPVVTLRLKHGLKMTTHARTS